ncbi:MFS transporter [Arthrobacter sp. AQ5-06]|nr:MFS transporter [Arthrobacter sp. AQ5-06]
MTTKETSRGVRTVPLVILGTLILCIDGSDLFLLGAVGPSLLKHPDWDVQITTLGLIGSVTSLGMPLGAIVAGWAGDRFGRKLPIAISLVWISLCMLFSALAPDVTSFTVSRFLTGLALGSLVPLAVAFVSDWAPARRKSLCTGIVLSGIGIGGLLSAFIGRALLPVADFQWLFALGVLPLLLVPAVLRVVPSYLPSAVKAESATPSVSTQKNTVAELFSPGFRLATPLFWVATFLGLVLVYGASTWLPTLMMERGYGLGSSLEFSMTFNIGAIVGTILITLLSDRGHLKMTVILCFVAAAAAMLGLTTQQPYWLLLGLSALAGMGTLGTQNVINIFVAQYYPDRIRGTALGFSLGIGRFGAIVGPTYLALVITLIPSQPNAGFYAFVIPAVIGALIFLLVPRKPSLSVKPVSAVESRITT